MRISIFSLFLLATFVGNGQSLTIKDLLYLRSKNDFMFTDSFLIKKKFHETDGKFYRLDKGGNVAVITYCRGNKGDPGFEEVVVYHEPNSITVRASCKPVDTAKVFRQIKNAGFHLRDAYACGADAQLRTYAKTDTGKLCINIHIHASLLYPSLVYCDYSIGSNQEN
jgi:hypothetical protein